MNAQCNEWGCFCLVVQIGHVVLSQSDPVGNGSGHAAWCRGADSCHCCCYGDSMFTAATHLCVAFRRYLVNRKTQSGEEEKAERIYWLSRTQHTHWNSIQAYKHCFKIFARLQNHHAQSGSSLPRTTKQSVSCGKLWHENETCGGSFRWTSY